MNKQLRFSNTNGWKTIKGRASNPKMQIKTAVSNFFSLLDWQKKKKKKESSVGKGEGQMALSGKV